jgi:hypothetical protein
LRLYPFGGVNYEHANISARNCLFGPHDRKDFNRAGMFAARTNPSGIDKKEAFTLPFVLDVDGIRVVPGISLTIARRSRSNALISDDFPAFGRPRIATAIGCVRFDN